MLLCQYMVVSVMGGGTEVGLIGDMVVVVG